MLPLTLPLPLPLMIKKNGLQPKKLHETIVTANLVPLAVSNTMLFIGTHMKAQDCDFELRKYFMIVGSLGLSLSAFAILGKFLIEEMTAGIGPCVKKSILYGISLSNTLLRITEIIMLIAGSVIVFSQWTKVSFERKEGLTYCQEVNNYLILEHFCTKIIYNL